METCWERFCRLRTRYDRLYPPEGDNDCQDEYWQVAEAWEQCKGEMGTAQAVGTFWKWVADTGLPDAVDPDGKEIVMLSRRYGMSRKQYKKLTEKASAAMKKLSQSGRLKEALSMTERFQQWIDRRRQSALQLSLAVLCLARHPITSMGRAVILKRKHALELHQTAQTAFFYQVHPTGLPRAFSAVYRPNLVI